MPGFVRAESIKAHGVTINRRFSVTEHVDNLLASCVQTLLAMRTLRYHGRQTNALLAIFHATVVTKLSYASPALRGFANVADKARLEAFLPCSSKFGLPTSLHSDHRHWHRVEVSDSSNMNYFPALTKVAT